MNRTEIIATHAAAMEETEMAYHRQNNPERLKTVTDEMLVKFRSKLLADAEKLAGEIEDREACYKAHQRGRFHPSNPNSRNLFIALTGIILPSTVSATDQAILAYCGSAAQTVNGQQRQDRERVEEEKRAKEIAEIEGKKAKYGALVKAGEAIDGHSLTELAALLGIEAHPRTIGMLRKRVAWIKEDSAGVRGGSIGNAAYDLYKQCRLALS